jgi:tetratricopeptide (TPR) repeat protein
MRKLHIVLICALLSCSILAGSEYDRLKALESSGVQNADLYYNLGVTYWQTGQSGMANLYFLKALNLNSAHNLAKENLDYVIALSEDRDLYPQPLFLVRVFFEVYDYLNLNRIAILSLILLIFSAISLSWLMHHDPDKERGLPSLIFGICLVLFLISAVLLGVKSYRMVYNSKAVVISATAELRAEPDAAAKRVALIHEALILIVEEERSEWCLVRTPDGNSGWIPTAALRKVVDP